MKSSSRSDWLLQSTKQPKSEKCGKKKFFIQKNTQSHHFPATVDVTASEQNRIIRLPSIEKRMKSSITPKSIKRDQEIQVTSPKVIELEVKLKQKDTQISMLRKLYSEADYRYKSPLPSNIKQNILKTDSSSKLSPAKNSNESIAQSMNLARRNNSLTNHSANRNPKIAEYLSQASRLVLSQKKYTRNQPKVIFTNPITGIVPIV